MNIAYCSMLELEDKIDLTKLKGSLIVSTSKVIKATIKGIEANIGETVKIFNFINVPSYPQYKQILFKSEKWSHQSKSEDFNLGFINITGLKYITRYRSLFRRLDEWVKSLNGEKCIICQYNARYPILKATAKIKKKYGDQVQLCMNVGDIPARLTGGIKNRFCNNAKAFLYDKLFDRSTVNMIESIDSFIFVTEHMNAVLNPTNKPYCVVECVYDQPVDTSKENIPEDKNHKRVFYAGSLREEYGIKHLLDAFSLIQDPNYRLVIAGAGEGEDVVRKYARKDKRIEQLGFISQKEVSRQQQLATVLVSPRINNNEFVKYSFPSKAVDSLASGKPYVAHRLDCDPPEYTAYIQYAEDDSDTALKDKLVEICQMPEDERKAIGEKGKNFVLTQKTPQEMCKKIVDMWKTQLS